MHHPFSGRFLIGFLKAKVLSMAYVLQEKSSLFVYVYIAYYSYGFIFSVIFFMSLSLLVCLILSLSLLYGVVYKKNEIHILFNIPCIVFKKGGKKLRE